MNDLFPSGFDGDVVRMIKCRLEAYRYRKVEGEREDISWRFGNERRKERKEIY